MKDVGPITGGSGPDAEPWPLKTAWVIIYLINLIVPLWFGMGTTRDGARDGMFLAIVILFALGFWVCLASRWFGTALVIGGGLVGVSQLYPMLQFMAGLFGVASGRRFGQEIALGLIGFDPHTLHSLRGGCIATIVTGGLLMTLALVLGMLIKTLPPALAWFFRGFGDA